MMNLQITGVSMFNTNRNNLKTRQNTAVSTPQVKAYDIMKSLDLIGRMNRTSINFGSNKPVKTYAGHEINFTEEELDTRLKDKTRTIKLLAEDAPEYKALAKGDKKALEHLVKAAAALDNVYLTMDHEKNIILKKALKEEIAKGDTHAQKAYKLGFEGMNGITGIDRMTNRIFIFKNTTYSYGRNYYTPGLKPEELIADLHKKFKEDKIHDIRMIMSQRSIVRKDKNGELYGIDYVDAFPKEFKAAANELEKAAKVSTNADFNKYLKAQAKAFRKADPELDCEADRLWAKLEDTPLEFTVTREGYEEKLTEFVTEDKKLVKQLAEHGIEAFSKDSIGIRVGIVDKNGNKELEDFKKYLPGIANLMPLKEKYTQTIKPKGDVKQTAVDVRLVCLAGDLNYRSGITVAENLPNDEKLSVKRNYGRRNVYHYEVRHSSDPKTRQLRLDTILDPALHKYDTVRGDHRATIGHENAHSLGPSKAKAALGQWKDIIEEGKADVGGLFCLDYLVEKGKYTEEEKKEILVSWSTGNLMKTNPNPAPEKPLKEGLKEASPYGVRALIQLNYFREKGAMNIDDKGILHINFEKMVPTARALLSDLVELQLAKKPEKAEEFIAKYSKWEDIHQKVADNIKKIDTGLHGVIEQPLAKKLLNKAKAIR